MSSGNPPPAGAGREAGAPGPAEFNRLAALFNAQRYAEVESLARSLLDRNPGLGLIWNILGTCRRMQGKEDLAAFQQAAQFLPDEAGVHYNLGDSYKALGQFVDAVASYHKALQINPAFAEAHINLGNVLQDLRQFEAAAGSYRRALEIRPDLAVVHSNLGNVLQDLGQFEGAAASYRRALELDPGFADAHVNLGVALQAVGRLDEAAASHRRALALAPDLAEAHVNLGNVLRDLGEHEAAVESYRRALRLERNFAEAHLGLSTALLDLGRLQEAEASCRQALQLKPGLAAAETVLDNIFRDQGALPEYLARDVFDFANERRLQRYFPYESNTFIYSIDVSGTCNLRCPTCPVGNFSEANRPKGFMDLELFRRILEKIQRERVAPNPKVWLYNWGEPLLHPRLPEMIALLKQSGIYVMLSTNLNIKKNLEAVIRSGPDELKISLSGFAQAFYSKTHVKGNIELVKQNMGFVRELMDKFGVAINVWVGHHRYRHNVHESADIMRLCRRLGFDYRPIPAFYQPLEKMVDLVEGRAAASEAALLANLPTHPLEALASKREGLSQHLDCESRFNMTAINYDGSVALCCGTYDAQNMLGVNFVDASHDEIQALKYRHPFCKKCYAYGLQYSHRTVAARQQQS